MSDQASKELIGKAIKSDYDSLRSLIARMLEYDADKRPTLNEAIVELGGQPVLDQNGQSMLIQQISVKDQQLKVKDQQLLSVRKENKKMNKQLLVNYQESQLMLQQIQSNEQQLIAKEQEIQQLKTNSSQQVLPTTTNQLVFFIGQSGTTFYLYFLEKAIVDNAYALMATNDKRIPSSLNLTRVPLSVPNKSNTIPKYMRQIQVNDTLYWIGGSLVGYCQKIIFSLSSVSKMLFFLRSGGFNPAVDTIALDSIGSLLQERDSFGICSYQNRFIFVIGGVTQDKIQKIANKECEMFDTMSNKSKQIAPLNQPCWNPSCFILGDRLFKCGGYTGYTTGKLLSWESGVEEYSLKDNVWRMVPVQLEKQSLRNAIMRPLYLSAFVRVSPNDVIVLGGSDKSHVAQKQQMRIRMRKEEETGGKCVLILRESPFPLMQHPSLSASVQVAQTGIDHVQAILAEDDDRTQYLQLLNSQTNTMKQISLVYKFMKKRGYQ